VRDTRNWRKFLERVSCASTVVFFWLHDLVQVSGCTYFLHQISDTRNVCWFLGSVGDPVGFLTPSLSGSGGPKTPNVHGPPLFRPMLLYLAVAVLGKNIWGERGLPLIIWEATAAKQNYLKIWGPGLDLGRPVPPGPSLKLPLIHGL